jgi:phage tail tape-measure protein
MRKLIAFDDDTFDKLKQLARDRMGTLQELADEAFADVLKKHGVPIDLQDALRKSAKPTKLSANTTAETSTAKVTAKTTANKTTKTAARPAGKTKAKPAKSRPPRRSRDEDARR